MQVDGEKYKIMPNNDDAERDHLIDPATSIN